METVYRATKAISPERIRELIAEVDAEEFRAKSLPEQVPEPIEPIEDERQWRGFVMTERITTPAPAPKPQGFMSIVKRMIFGNRTAPATAPDQKRKSKSKTFFTFE